jgi:hypothetical protein
MTSLEGALAASPEPTDGAEPSTHQHQNGVMPPPQREAFEAELARIRAGNTSGPLDGRLATVGVVTVVVGAVVILACYAQARSFDDLRDQVEVLVLALLGLGLMIVGSVLYLRSSMTRFMRYWLLRLIYEQRQAGGGDPGEDGR